MDGELWRRLYQLIEAVATAHAQDPAMGFSDATVVATYAFSVLHDRPVCWACDAANWGQAPEARRPAAIPSQPTMSRRLRHDAGVRRFLDELEQTLAGSLCLCRLWLYRLLDAKPLPVGRYSKDPDAAVGHGAGGIDKGYKAHTLWHAAPVPVWEVRPMNVAEQTVALRLVARAGAGEGEGDGGGGGGGGYVLADKGYDSGRVHDRCAAHGLQLLAPPQKPRGAGRGHGPQNPHRRHALELLRRPMGRDLLRLRYQVEQRFGHLCSFGGGLAPLPAWVRRLRRVRQWVQMKLILNALRMQRVLERTAA
jgi:hypothetical protein